MVGTVAIRRKERKLEDKETDLVLLGGGGLKFDFPLYFELISALPSTLFLFFNKLDLLFAPKINYYNNEPINPKYNKIQNYQM